MFCFHAILKLCTTKYYKRIPFKSEMFLTNLRTEKTPKVKIKWKNQDFNTNYKHKPWYDMSLVATPRIKLIISQQTMLKTFFNLQLEQKQVSNRLVDHINKITS